MSAVMRSPESARAAWLCMGVAAAAALALYTPLVPALVREWSEFPSLSHGFAVPFIAAYLIWARREQLRQTPIAPSLAGVPVLVVGLVALTLGVRGDEAFAARISLPVTLLGLILLLAGKAVLAKAWLGVAYLVFMVPLPYATLKLLMYRSRILDATVSAHALGWLGVPVLQEGVMLHLPNMVLEVADDCSSIPALAALLSLGVAYASLTPRPIAVRVAIVAAAIPFAIGANMVRIISTAAGVYYIGPWTLNTVYHLFNGTVNFLLTFLLLLAFDALLMRFVRRAR